MMSGSTVQYLTTTTLVQLSINGRRKNPPQHGKDRVTRRVRVTRKLKILSSPLPCRLNTKYRRHYNSDVSFRPTVRLLTPSSKPTLHRGFLPPFRTEPGSTTGIGHVWINILEIIENRTMSLISQIQYLTQTNKYTHKYTYKVSTPFRSVINHRQTKIYH